ncbi:MAG: hypothetical protein HYZ14_14605 [Bacteroidetes bacterium]|nr:hypothetical protein [Bacteroidota bacterium]
MKNVLRTTVLIFSVLVSNTGFTQYSITPGVGFSTIHIGMHTDELINVLGTPESIIPQAEERAAWEDAGYNTKSELPYLLGFDEVLTFGLNEFLVWKTYIRNDQINYMTLTTYAEFESGTEKIDVNGQIHFYDTWAAIQKIMGTGFVKRKRDETTTLYMYLELGISFNLDEDALRNIFIYTPVAATTAKKYAKKMKH